MSDNGTTTIWQDPNNRIRKHKLMTKELGYIIPALFAIERDLYWKPTTLGEIKRQESGIAA